MKKIFCLLIITAFIGLYCKPVTSNANQVLDKGVKEIEKYGEFNYFRGITPEEFTGKTQIIFGTYLEQIITDGEILTSVTVKNTVQKEFKFYFSYVYANYVLTSIKVHLDETLIYEAKFDENSITEVKVCEKIIVEEKTKVKNDYFKIISYNLISMPDEYTFSLEELEGIGMFPIQGHRYRYNAGYEGKDVYFVTSIDNLVSFEDIKEKLTAEDATDGNLTDKIEIYNNTYDPTDENITIGDYRFDAVVYDSSGNTTYQTCYVKVVDLQAPEINVSEPCEVSYTVLYPWSTFLKNFTVTDNVEVEKVEVTEDTYTKNYDKPGTYHITATATDTSGNTSSAVLTINVVDKKAPTIEGPYEITTSTLNPLTKEQIRQHFTFSDDIDLDVTNYEIIDYDGYFEKTNVAGTYSFKIVAYDTYGNEGGWCFDVIVKDTDYPYITIDSNYTIVINHGEQISREDIINFLNESGLLDQTVVDVESEVFDDENPSGTYEASIVLDDGTVIKNKLVVSHANYNPPLVAKKGFPILLTCAIFGAILLVSYLYFRRNRRTYVRR